MIFVRATMIFSLDHSSFYIARIYRIIFLSIMIYAALLGGLFMTGELRLYEIFYTVAQYQSFSKAADALYISQPAISKAIKTLEIHLNILLFTRTSKGITLTPEGSSLFEYVKDALQLLESGKQKLHKLQSLQDGQLHLGVSSTLGTYFLLPHLKNFTEDYPDINLQITNDSTTKTLELLDQGKIDLAIVSAYQGYEHLDFLPIQQIEDIFVCSPEYYEQIKNLDLNALCKQGCFLFQSMSSVTRLHIENILEEKHLAIHPNIVAGDMYFLVQCSKLGLGITFVVKDFVTKELKDGSLIELDAINLPSRHIGIVTNSQFALSLAAKAFIHYLQEETLH